MDGIFLPGIAVRRRRVGPGLRFRFFEILGIARYACGFKKSNLQTGLKVFLQPETLNPEMLTQSVLGVRPSRGNPKLGSPTRILYVSVANSQKLC